MLDGEERSAKRISMIAGGTGITPMYQVSLPGPHAMDSVVACVLWALRLPL